MHDIIKNTLIVLLIIEVVGKILIIDQERPPVTKGVAALTAIFNGAFIYAIIKYL